MPAGLDTTRPAVPSSVDPENPPPVAGLEVDDVERQQTSSRARCIIFLVSTAIVACILVPSIYYLDEDTDYSVAIDSASVLDPNTGVSFNLTLVIASRSHGAKSCVDPSTMFIEVFYHGVQVAAATGTDPAATTGQKICARPRSVAELPVMARATMLPVGQMQDCLAAEMGQGAAVFDLRLSIPSYRKSGLVLDCKGSRIGGSVVPCHY